MNIDSRGSRRMFRMVEELKTIEKPQAFSSFSHSFLGYL